MGTKGDNMFELLEKMLYAGVGAVAVTEQKARELVNELEKKGHVTKEEGTKLVNELVEKGKKASEDIKKTVDDEVKRVMDKIHFAKKEEVDALAREVRELSAKLDQLLGQRNV